MISVLYITFSVSYDSDKKYEKAAVDRCLSCPYGISNVLHVGRTANFPFDLICSLFYIIMLKISFLFDFRLTSKNKEVL